MSKNTISTFTLIILIGAVMWFFHMNHVSEERSVEPVKTGAAVAEAADPIVVASTPAPTPRRISSKASDVSGQLQTLEQQLADAQASLVEQQQNYNQLTEQSRVFQARAPAADDRNNLNVMRSESQIQNNLMEMDSYRSLEEQISRQADEQIRQANSAVQMDLEQINQNIQAQQQSIQRTREDLAYWSRNYNDATVQQAQLDSLSAQLAAQGEQLELMLQQRALISASALSQSQAIQLQKREALAGISANRSDAQGEVETLRDSIIRLQQSQREIRNTQVSFDSQLKQAQSSLRTQEGQVKQLEGAVQQKRQELESLVQ